jgi:hypothetical protein
MNDSVSLSHRFYRFLLRAYPPSFYAEYGDEMALTFRDSCRTEYRQHGAIGVMGKWAETVPDIIVSMADEHSQENFQMAKTTLIRVLAVAGIVGGALWIASGVMLFMRAPGIPGGEADYPLPLIAFGPVTAGLLGVYLHRARSWPSASKFTLLLAVAGGLWATFIPLFITNFWIVMMLGFLVQIGGLSFVGLILLAQPATRQWAILFIALAAAMFMLNGEENWRGLFVAVAGILYIALFALLLGGSLNHQSEPPLAA